MSRDLGTLGESVFQGWCAGIGLVSNGSKIDKTGWDFLVEFPLIINSDCYELHKSGLECRV